MPPVCILWRNVYLDLLSIFLIRLVVFFFISSYMSCLNILQIKPLSVTSFTKIFSHSIGCFLFYLWFPLLCKNLIWSHLFIFLVLFPLGESPKRDHCGMSKSVLPVFSSRSFIVFGLLPILSLFLYVVLKMS